MLIQLKLVYFSETDSSQKDVPVHNYILMSNENNSTESVLASAKSISSYTVPSYTSNRSGDKKVLLVPLCYHPYCSSVMLTVTHWHLCLCFCLISYMQKTCVHMHNASMHAHNLIYSKMYQHWKIYCKPSRFSHNPGCHMNVNWSFLLPFLVLWPVQKAWK